ncbi:hypothetical protein ACHQM5_008683 [Ranunculus cassubicifolius]
MATNGVVLIVILCVSSYLFHMAESRTLNPSNTSVVLDAQEESPAVNVTKTNGNSGAVSTKSSPLGYTDTNDYDERKGDPYCGGTFDLSFCPPGVNKHPHSYCGGNFENDLCPSSRQERAAIPHMFIIILFTVICCLLSGIAFSIE